MPTDNEFLDYLMSLGLSEKEAKTYLHLLKYGPKTPSPLSKSLHTYHKHIHRTLTSLIEKGMVRPSLDTPSLFSAVDLNSTVDAKLKMQESKLREMEALGLPLSLTWIRENELAISYYPYASDFSFLYDNGIRAIVSIEERPDVSLLKSKGFDYLEIADWEDMTAPTLDQLDIINLFIGEKIGQGKPVLVHCIGRGRSGAACISYLIYAGIFNTCKEAYRYVREVKQVYFAAPTKEQRTVLRAYTDSRRLSNVRRN